MTTGTPGWKSLLAHEFIGIDFPEVASKKVSHITLANTPLSRLRTSGLMTGILLPGISTGQF